MRELTYSKELTYGKEFVFNFLLLLKMADRAADLLVPHHSAQTDTTG